MAPTFRRPGRRPLVDPGDREQFERLRAGMEDGVGAHAVAAACTRGEALALDRVVEQFLDAG